MSFFQKLLRTESERLCDQGLAALDRRDFATAAKAFQSCAEDSRRESTVRLARFHLAECHTQLALKAWNEGERAQAFDQIEVALAYSQPTAERHLVAAQIARQLGDRTGAGFHLDAALALSPANEQAMALRALEWYEEGRTDEALVHAEALPQFDGRLRRFREAHDRGERDEAAAHLLAVASGYPTSLL